jgi:hypothetical protein
MIKDEPASYANDTRDAIERFNHGLTEHPFLIPAKIATISAGRLTAPKS